ncbi:hypothetical protein AB0K21_28045 [Streptosporangium sp. NPDC049248]|uniref:hypothetical protein n=1 Tax=Streptosporangium sp. NPDC049248 TaxID=3155651 RepID=UPI00341A0E83
MRADDRGDSGDEEDAAELGAAFHDPVRFGRLVERQPGVQSGAQSPLAPQAGVEGARRASGRRRPPVYRFWHGHTSALIAARRPDLDGELLAHILLGSLQ